VSAIEELREFLGEGEKVEALCFGEWGWGSHITGQLGYGEPDPPPVPFDLRGKLLTLEQAEPIMESWSFDGGYGATKCYATYIWTDRRVIWVTQYDGSTCLSAAPRNPVATMPGMPGG